MKKLFIGLSLIFSITSMAASHCDKQINRTNGLHCVSEDLRAEIQSLTDEDSQVEISSAEFNAQEPNTYTIFSNGSTEYSSSITSSYALLEAGDNAQTQVLNAADNFCKGINSDSSISVISELKGNHKNQDTDIVQDGIATRNYILTFSCR